MAGDLDEIGILREIRGRIEALPEKLDELGFAGRAEMEIASLYERLHDHASAGDWWVNSALQAERYNQIIDAHSILEVGARSCPEHLGIRREIARIGNIIKVARDG